MTRILIIDDDLDVRDQVATTLLASYFETYTATDGRDGVEKALKILPDLIICDMMMPFMDGQQVLAELRKHKVTELVPFIFLTAVDTRDIVRSSMNLGADDYLFKPVNIAELLNTVTARLKRHQSIVATSEEQVEAIKVRLARTVTHELRTPVSLVVTAMQMLQWQTEDQLSPDNVQLIATLNRGATRLAHVVEQMVYATQLTTGAFSTESIAEKGYPTDIGKLIASAHKLALQFTSRQPQQVEVKVIELNDSLFVKAELGALKQAIAEVISNAIAFSPEGGKVRIIYKRIGNDVRITITDNGHGIPDSQLKEAMAWFGQVDREHQEQQGMGMGLPLASQLITIHGGSLDIRSIVGKGTQAVITLPTVEASV